MSHCLDLIESLSRDTTIADAYRSLQSVAEPLGCGAIAFARIRHGPGVPSVADVGAPPVLDDYFRPDGLWRSDPLTHVSRFRPSPFVVPREDLLQFGEPAAARVVYEMNEANGGTSKLVFTVPGEAGSTWLCVYGGVYAKRDLHGTMSMGRDVLALSMALVAARIAQFGARVQDPPRLSPREREVLSHLAAGRRGDAIAWRMGITLSTVDLHVANARRKLGAATREQALVEAIRYGLIVP